MGLDECTEKFSDIAIEKWLVLRQCMHIRLLSETITTDIGIVNLVLRKD